MFLYQSQLLWMSGSYGKISLSDGSRKSRSRSFKRFRDCQWLSCWTLGYWLQNPPESFERTNLAGERRQWYREEGFKFDDVTQKWYCSWEYHEVYDVYHTTHRQEEKIEFVFDADEKKGQYIYYFCSETLE